MHEWVPPPSTRYPLPIAVHSSGQSGQRLWGTMWAKVKATKSSSSSVILGGSWHALNTHTHTHEQLSISVCVCVCASVYLHLGVSQWIFMFVCLLVVCSWASPPPCFVSFAHWQNYKLRIFERERERETPLHPLPLALSTLFALPKNWSALSAKSSVQLWIVVILRQTDRTTERQSDICMRHLNKWVRVGTMKNVW